ncbi:unnamed protein product [Effrenium voratum]|uniref:Uncharacterized protein n=1 Tax=Effrenium voratum TaxID=2562239 RepID=A0AA36NKD0_9DINO|nr:unnamed protein product [Effrenium voratum]CAJ1405773.1 unnamed protein product [Effrenium voratum]CAJ1415473.1 unnamed protein product [Effrenium voratum]
MDGDLDLKPKVPLPAAFVRQEEALRRCREMLSRLPPMEGSVKYERAWGIEESLEQFQCLMKQHELQSSVGQSHVSVRQLQAKVCALQAADVAKAAREALGAAQPDLAAVMLEAKSAARQLSLALRMQKIKERHSAERLKMMEEEIKKSNAEMTSLREGIEDVSSGGGPPLAGPIGAGKAEVGANRKWFYCSDCHVGGHGQRFCRYLLKRPNWRIYPSERWFEDRNGQVSHCPLGKKAVDFTDETYFSRIAMHIKGRIWLEDKRKLYEFVPDLMPYTYVIQNRQWVGEVPEKVAPDAPPWPWFLKETDRNWGTSVVCCANPDECLQRSKDDATYVVQKHIPDPLHYYNGEKCHIKFYNLLVGLDDGVTWRLYTYRDGYLSISPKAWSPTDLSKECQVTIIRTKRINDWPYWDKVYPKCQAGVATVIKRAAEQGKLEGRNKVQFEIISADYIVTASEDVYLLEFNTGPVLKDAEDSPDVHDAGMVDGALHIVEPWEGGDPNLWDLAIECQGVPPKPEEFPSDA